jgi:3-hydroxyacyl-[acyl-carrier-protein] dehydratase
MSPEESAMVLDFEAIRRLLPQAHPFLMLDRVDVLEPGKRVVGRKCITGNETFFQGHFPGMAIMPAALILESLAQATIVLVRRTIELQAKPGAAPDDSVYLFGAVHARMQRPVFPGDVMNLEVDLVKLFGEGGAAEGKATVDGKVCTQAEMYFSKVRIGELRKGR